jgi:hypothetical protein
LAAISAPETTALSTLVQATRLVAATADRMAFFIVFLPESWLVG